MCTVQNTKTGAHREYTENDNRLVASKRRIELCIIGILHKVPI